jgi:hypothetical protein
VGMHNLSSVLSPTGTPCSRKYLAICLRVIRRAEFIFVTLLEATGNSG